MPVPGQMVALRVGLPFGGRGFLYGAVSSVSSAPTDDEMRTSGSKLLGRLCRCSDPNCTLKNGTREEIVSTFGAVHGQEITAVVSLSSPYFVRKLRFAPLPSFFKGESTMFEVVLRWDEEVRWNVVKISMHTK